MFFNSQIRNRKRVLPTALLIVVASICALGLPFVGVPMVAGVLAAVSAAFLIVNAERKPLTVIFLFGFASIFFTEEGISLVALVLSMIVGCGAFARVLERVKSPFLWAIPVGAFVIGAVVTGDLLIASLSLGFALPAAALSFSFSRRYARVGAICLISGAFMVFFAAFVLGDAYAANGSISISVFTEGAEIYRESFTEILMQIELMDVTAQSSSPVFTELEARNLATEIVSLFPAFFVIGCNAAAYFSQKLMYEMVHREGDDSKFEDKMIALIMSPYAGATFLLSFFVMIFAASSADYALAYTVSENIFYIFVPGLSASGIMFQLAKVARLRRGLWMVILFVVLAFVNIGVAILLTACTGAFYSIATPVFAFLNSKKDNDNFQ